MWDLEVDLVCLGAGIGGLAGAIATVDAGAEVIVADTTPHLPTDGSAIATRRRVGSMLGWLQHDAVDLETNEYFHALAEGLDPLTRRVGAAGVPTRVASEWAADERVVEKFVGAAVRDWDAQCLGSPYGMLHSSIYGWQATRMRSSDGESIEVVPLGSMDWHDGLDGTDLLEWMDVQVLERDIEVLASSALERLVFEEGAIAGVVLATPDGPYTVRTTRGVMVSPRDHDLLGADRPIESISADTKQVCLVGRTASRFGRVELVTPAAPPAVFRPLCTSSGRHLHEALRESRQVPSDAWRGGKVHRHPPRGK
jgi:FAD binding domain